MPDFSINQLGITKRLCPEARAFGQCVEQTIFSKITQHTTPEQYQQAQNLLLALCERFAERLTCGTFPTAVGIHSCVRDISEDAAARLACLAVMYQPPLPPVPTSVPPVPAPKRPLRSDDAVVNDIESLADAMRRPGNTYLGEERKDNTASGGSE